MLLELSFMQKELYPWPTITQIAVVDVFYRNREGLDVENSSLRMTAGYSIAKPTSLGCVQQAGL